MIWNDVIKYFENQNKQFTPLQYKILTFINDKCPNIDEINKEIFSKWANKPVKEVMFTPANYYGLICKEYCLSYFNKYYEGEKIRRYLK